MKPTARCLSLQLPLLLLGVLSGCELVPLEKAAFSAFWRYHAGQDAIWKASSLHSSHLKPLTGANPILSLRPSPVRGVSETAAADRAESFFVASSSPHTPGVATREATEAAAGATLPFTAGLFDSALPPQSDNPPRVDRTFCREDIIPFGNCFPTQEPTCVRQAQGSDGLFRAVGLEGPVSFFDGRTQLHPSLAGASDDAFLIDFHGPIQLGAVEIAESALSAAKRFASTRELKSSRRHRLCQKGVGMRDQTVGDGRDVRSKVRSFSSHPEAASQCSNLVVGSTDLEALLKEHRFRKPPYWLVERVAYALRRLRPSSFGFLVAQMLEALCRVVEAERKLGMTIDDFVAHRMQTYTQKLRRMSPLEHALHLTKGHPRAFKDVLKFRRGFPVFPWGLSEDPEATRCFMREKLLVEEEALTQHFFAARRVAGERWTSAAVYRVATEELPLEIPRRVYEGFNSAAITSITHVAAGWQRPVYVVSVLERARSLRQLLAALGVPRAALQRVHIYGADGFLMGTDPDDQTPRESPPGVSVNSLRVGCDEAVTPNEQGDNNLEPKQSAQAEAQLRALNDSAERRKAQTASSFGKPTSPLYPSDIALKLKGAFALWQFHKRMGFNGVPHFIDDDVRVLEAAAADPRMDRWRLYFCDWGFSTYEEKLQAVISDRLKILPTMSRMAELLLTPAYLATRLWALGSTTAPAEWLEEGRMSRWLRLSGAVQMTPQTMDNSTH